MVWSQNIDFEISDAEAFKEYLQKEFELAKQGAKDTWSPERKSEHLETAIKAAYMFQKLSLNGTRRINKRK